MTTPQFTPLSVLIQTKAEAAAGKSVFPSVQRQEDAQELVLHDVGILEGGMASGRTSVMLRLTGPDGRQYLAQTSAALFTAAAGAVKGAQERFGDKQ